MPKSEVLLYSCFKFNATAILYKLAICKGKICGIVLYDCSVDGCRNMTIHAAEG